MQAAGIGNGYHAFDYPIDWMSFFPAKYKIEAFAYSPEGGSPHLGNSPRYFTVRPCTGNFESIGAAGASGWAYKPDCPNSTIQVHVYWKNTDTGQQWAQAVLADTFRADLLANGIGNGYHSWSCPISWGNYPIGRYQIKAYAYVGDNDKILLDTKNYTNAPPHGSIRLYGIEHSDTADRKLYYTPKVKNACLNIGTTELDAVITGTTAANSLLGLRSSMIWAIHTHGWQTGIVLNHKSAGETYLTYSDVSALPDNSLSSERCVIYGTCNAGEGGVQRQIWLT